MRLLHLDASGKPVLVDFDDDNLPPYAILSHTWSDSEISFEDLLNDTYKEKEEGYRKLRLCANQASQDGLKNFWIDACCIESNSLEMSKAIKSMAKLYKDATRCYVVLSDLSFPPETGTVQRSNWEESFRKSAWVSRTWTLQEYFLSSSVEFFSREGHRIEDKAWFQAQIEAAYSMRYDDDRLSIQSIESSTTLVSTSSGLTTVEKSATVELQRVFQEDVELASLYRLALKDPSVESDRLQRNIARLLKLFAKDLRREAETNLERMASRFVRSKAPYIAYCIVEEFNDTPRNSRQPHPLVEQGRSDGDGREQEEDANEVVEAQPEVDGIEELALIDDDYFEDLARL